MTSTTNYGPLLSELSSKISSVSRILATATDQYIVYPESQTLARLQASYQYISNEQILQTAAPTATLVQESASQAMAQASETIIAIHEANNLYSGMTPSYGGNLALAIIMGIFFLLHTISGVWYKQWWFVIAFFCGCGLEMAGYIGRTLSNGDYTVLDYFLLQIICLTIAPAFIMGGLYYLLVKLIMIYGVQYAIMSPMLYSYIFITCDVISLAVQAAGGGLAATALTANESSAGGTHVMVAGLAFQVFSMSIYIFLLVHFFHKIKIFHKKQHDELEFDPDHAHLRSKKLFKIFPYVIFTAVILVYVRCIYRVVELAEGWSGYLITHEAYFMILDALMMGLSILLLLIVHPGKVFDERNEAIHVKGMKGYSKKMKEKEEESTHNYKNFEDHQSSREDTSV